MRRRLSRPRDAIGARLSRARNRGYECSGHRCSSGPASPIRFTLAQPPPQVQDCCARSLRRASAAHASCASGLPSLPISHRRPFLRATQAPMNGFADLLGARPSKNADSTGLRCEPPSARPRPSCLHKSGSGSSGGVLSSWPRATNLALAAHRSASELSVLNDLAPRVSRRLCYAGDTCRWSPELALG